MRMRGMIEYDEPVVTPGDYASMEEAICDLVILIKQFIGGGGFGKERAL